MGTVGIGFDWVRYLGSMAIVLLLLAGLLLLLRRFRTQQREQHVGNQLHLLETINVGPRQKISLLRVGSNQVLIGIAPGQFTALGHWADSQATRETDLVP